MKNGTFCTADLNILGKYIFRFCKYVSYKKDLYKISFFLGLGETFFQTWIFKFIVNQNQALSLEVLLTLSMTIELYILAILLKLKNLSPCLKFKEMPYPLLDFTSRFLLGIKGISANMNQPFPFYACQSPWR